ncbi:MAG: hypothetical protein ACXVBY_17380, partial [Isosphaeraceae bacterium]
VWVFGLGRGKGVGKSVLMLMCPFLITRIGVMANGFQPMNLERAVPGSIRTADLLGLSASALRQQKVRTLLTLAGVVIGTFTLVVSLAVGRGVDRAIVSLFHEDDRRTANRFPVNSSGARIRAAQPAPGVLARGW